MSRYSFVKGLVKSLKYIALFLLGSLAVGLTPNVKELTVGGLLVLAYNYLKVAWAVKLP